MIRPVLQEMMMYVRTGAVGVGVRVGAGGWGGGGWVGGVWWVFGSRGGGGLKFWEYLWFEFHQNQRYFNFQGGFQ